MYLTCPACGTMYPVGLLGVQTQDGVKFTTRCSTCRATMDVVVTKGWFKTTLNVTLRDEDYEHR